MFYVQLPHERIEWLLETNGDPQGPLGALGIGLPGAIAGGAALSGITSLIGGGKQASAATRAAQIQANAALQAANLQQQRFQTVAGTLDPFIQYGQQFMNPLLQLTGVGGGGAGVLNAPLTQLPGQVVQQWAPTTQQLEQMPGYQFQVNQALKAAQSQVIGQLGQGGRGGPSLLTAETVASGLAGENWAANWQQFMQQQGLNLQQQQLNLQGRAQTFNMLAGGLQTGLGAAGALGGVSVQNAANIGNALQAAGAAQAGGTVGASNVLFGAQGGVTGLGQSIAGIPQNILLGSILANQAGAATQGEQQFLIPGTDQALNPISGGTTVQQ